MNNKEYGYKKLSDQVYSDVRSAVAESGEKAVQDGIKDILNTNLKKTGFSFSKFGNASKNFNKMIKDALTNLSNNKPLTIEPNLIIDPTITTLNDRDLLNKIQDLYEESGSASTKGEILRYAQNLIYATKTAQVRGLDREFPEINSILKSLTDPYDLYYGEFIDTIKSYIQETEQIIANQHIYKAMEEFTKQSPQIDTKIKADKSTTQQQDNTTIKKQQKQLKQVQEINTELKKQEKLVEEINQEQTKTDNNSLSSNTDIQTVIDEITQAESRMGNEAQEATDQTKQGLAEMREEAERTQETIVGFRKYFSGNGFMNTRDDIAWLSSVEEIAKTYKGDTLAKAVLDSSKILTVDAEGAGFNNITYNGQKMDTDQIAEYARQLGYLGVQIKNVKDAAKGGDALSDTIAIFNKDLILGIENAVDDAPIIIEKKFKIKPLVDWMTHRENRESPLINDINNYTQEESEFANRYYGRYANRIGNLEETKTVLNELETGVISVEKAWEKLDSLMPKFQMPSFLDSLDPETFAQYSEEERKFFENTGDIGAKKLKEVVGQLEAGTMSLKEAYEVLGLLDKLSNETPVLPKESIKETQEQIQETNVELEKQEELIEEITQKRKEADKVSGKFLHITDKDFDKFDLSKSKGGQLGSGAYFIDEDEHLPDTFPGKYIKEVEINLEKCFILTKNYISSLSDLNEILGTSIPEGTDSRQIANEIRKYTTNHAKEFAEQMLAKGYQGLYTSDYLTMRKGNTDRKNELVVYDETKLDKIKSFTKNGFQELKNVEEIPQQIEKANESLDEFQQKIKGIKEFSEEYDLFDFKDFDEETLDKLQNTLFSLTGEDLKKLGFENTDEILEDLATINERLAEVRWQFENNDFTDEGWTKLDQLDDYVDTSLQSASVLNEIAEVDDTARISVQRLIDTISDYNGQQVNEIIDVKPDELKVIDQATEAINKEKEASEKANQQLQEEAENRIDLLGLINDINRESQNTSLNLNTQDAIIEEKKLQEQIEDTTEIINQETQAIEKQKETSTKTSNAIVKTYAKALEEIDNLQKNIDNYNTYGVAYSHYLNKQKEYAGLTNEELLNKYQEKIEDKTHYDKNLSVDSLKEKWGGILALIEEIQKRTGELKDVQVFNTSGKINEIKNYYEPLKEYISSDNIFSNLSAEELQSNFASTTRYLNYLKSILPELLKTTGTDLEKAEYHLKEILNSFSAKRNDDVIDLVKTLNDISKIKGQNVSLDDYKYLIEYGNEKRFKSASKKFNAFINDKTAKKTDEESIRSLIDKAINQGKITPYSTAAIARMLKNNNLEIESFTDNSQIILSVNQALERLNKTKKESIELSQEQIKEESNQADIVPNVQKKTNEEIESQNKLQSALKETAQVQEQVDQQQQSSTNDNINSYRNLIKTMKEFVDAVTSQRQTAQQTNTDEVTQSNKDLANASENTAAAISLESQSAINAANSLNQLTTAKQINTEQEEKLAQKTLEAASALMIESDAAKDVAKNIDDLSQAKLKNVKEKSSNNILNHNKNNDIVSNTDKAKSVDQITEALKELNKTEKDYQILENKRNQKGALTDKENAKYQELLAIRERDNQILSQQTVYTEKQNIAYQEYLETVKKVSAYIKGLNNNDTFILDTQKKLDSLFKQDKHTDEYYNRLKEIQVLLNQMANTTSNVDFMNLKSQVTTYLDDVVKNGDAFKTISEVSRSKLSNRMQEWLESNTKASTKYRKEIERLIKILKTIDNQSDLKNIETQFLDIKSLNASEGNSGKSFGKRILNRIADQNSKFLAQYFSIQDWIRYIRQMGQTIVEIDSAITELRKVSNASDERLSLSFEKSAQTAKELGDSITNVINVTADWSRLGYDVDAAEELARVTTLFKNVGDNMSAEDASSYLISTLQGFQKDASEAERIIDTYNEVANNFAIDTRGIGEALQRSAASFNAANTDLSGAVAVITAANSVVQNPEQIGTAMKTLSARIRGSKAELEELGEEEENVVELTSKLRNEVKAMTGFDIMEDEDTYKSIDEIIIGIGEHWQELTDIQQAALAEDLAGKRNSNVLIALLQNAELVKKVYETAEGAAGSATKEQENYAKSIQYSLDRFKATWQEIQTNLLQSDNVKSLVESAATALDGLGKSAELLAEPLSFVMKLLGGLFELLGKLSEMTNGWGTAGLLGAVVVGLKRKSKNNDLRSILSDDLLKETNSGRNKKPFLIIAGCYSSLSWDTSLNIA